MNNIERSRAAKVAAEFFGTGQFEDTARRNGYLHLVCLGRPGSGVEIPAGCEH